MNENDGKWKKIKEHERKWMKMKEKERKWKKMKENERKWKKMKENERKWKKMKENERKWKKMKKRKKRKNEKMKKNDEKKKKKNEKMDSHAKSSTISRVYRWCCNFFLKILNDFHDFVSECVSFPKKINNPFWGVTVIPKRSDKFHWTWIKNTHILPTKINDGNSPKVSQLFYQ